MRKILFILAFTALAAAGCQIALSRLPPAADAPPGLGYERVYYDIICPPSSEEAYAIFTSADSALSEGDLATAEAALRNAIELDPGFCDAMNHLGSVLEQQNRVEEAIQWYQRALQAKPDDLPTLLTLGIAYTKVHKNDQAFETCQSIVKLNPEQPDGSFCLALAYYAIQDEASALQYVDLAMSQFQEQNALSSADAQIWIGSMFMHAGDFNRALDYLQPLESVRGDDEMLLAALGGCYLYRQPPDAEKARDYYQRSAQYGVTLSAKTQADLDTLLNR